MIADPVSPFSGGDSTQVRAVHDEFHGDLLEVSMGPHHPSTHGVFRMIVTLDGETIVKLKPVFGYLHRNHEKLGENTTYLGSMPYTDRLDYLCSMTNNWAYAMSVEKLTGLVPPERAEYLRIILAELTRLINHSGLAGFLMQDTGCSGTPLMYAFREREKILDLFESLSGSRMMCNYQRFGGCRVDPPAEWLDATCPPALSWTRRRSFAACGPSPARPTAASRARRARSAFISSATVRPIRTATAYGRPPSSTSPSSRISASATPSPMPWSSSAASTSSSAKWTAESNEEGRRMN